MRRSLAFFLLVQFLFFDCVTESVAAPDDHEDSSVSISVPVSDEDFSDRVEELEGWIPKGFNVVVERPFVVIGNERKAKVERRAHRTIRGTVERLKKDFFAHDPNVIIEVWLFRDGPSYRKYSREIFGYDPDTPYGYYLESEQALVMNISTGAGTLNHEIVHPFMATNFPDCPPWFNEGLGSLYECSTTVDGHIWGLTNWRLRGLKKAIRQGSAPSFEELMSYNESQFYEEDTGSNYGQSRYLLQYLQEKGLLVTYFQEFLKNSKIDPTGIKTLKRILDIDDLDAFKVKWEKWVKKLTLKR